MILLKNIQSKRMNEKDIAKCSVLAFGTIYALSVTFLIKIISVVFFILILISFYNVIKTYNFVKKHDASVFRKTRLFILIAFFPLLFLFAASFSSCFFDSDS